MRVWGRVRVGVGLRLGLRLRRRLRAGAMARVSVRARPRHTRSPLSGAQKAAVMSREVEASAVTKRKARRSEMYL